MVSELTLKAQKKFKNNQNVVFNVTAMHQDGRMEILSANNGSIRVRKEFMKYFLSSRVEMAGCGKKPL